MMKSESQSLDVMTRIKAAYASLSKSHQKVADFILDHGIEVVYLSATSIAEAVNVNRSTVVRTAQSLGYEGFLDLQTDLQVQLLGQVRSAASSTQAPAEIQSSASNEVVDSVLYRIVHTELRNVERILQQVPLEDFDRAVELLASARRVYIVGLRGSYPLAQTFAMLLHYVRPDCFILESGSKALPDQIEQISKDDVLFAISYTRYVHGTILCAEYAKEIGASIVAVTDDASSSAFKLADLAFVIPFRLLWYANSVALFTLINALFAALFLRNPKATQQRIARLNLLYEKFQLFQDETTGYKEE